MNVILLLLLVVASLLPALTEALQLKEKQIVAFSPLTKNEVPLKQAKKLCLEGRGHLADADMLALKWARQTVSGAVWFRDLKVGLRAIPSNLTVLYRKGKSCCRASSSGVKCSRKTCDYWAPALCTMSKRKRGSKKHGHH